MKPLFANPAVARILAPLFLGALVLLAWQAACKYWDIPVYLFPAPLDIAKVLVTQAPALGLALAATLKVTLLALGLSVVLGVLFAFLLVQSRILEACLMPYAILLQVTPVVAVAPLIIILVKEPTPALVLCAVMVAIFPIISNTVLGLRSAAPGLGHLFSIYRANRWQVLWRLRIPAALPYFFAGLRISSGLALIGAVVAEFVAGTGGPGAGLAYQILQAGQQLEIPLMFAALGLITLAGVGLYLLTAWASRAALGRWQAPEVL